MLSQSQAKKLLEEGSEQYRTFPFHYAEAALVAGRLIAEFTPAAGSQTERMLLASAYELRARARFNLNNTLGAEADLKRLLETEPGYQPPEGISPEVKELFETVKRQTVGRLVLTFAPLGEVTIDGLRRTVRGPAELIPLVAGEHTLTAERSGYRRETQSFTVPPDQDWALSLSLERVWATVKVTTIPDEVEVLVDGLPRGSTRGEMLVEDLPVGEHRLLLRRACYVTVDRKIPIDRLDDITLDPIHLVPAVATASISTTASDAIIYLDGKAQGPAPRELKNVCEGEHVVELRSQRGRFIERRVWRTGESRTITAELRPALPLLAVGGGEAAVASLRAAIERRLTEARGLLIYWPGPREIEDALRDDASARQWFGGGAVPTQRAGGLSREALQAVGRAMAARLEAQGIAWIAAVQGAQATFELSLLAAGSSEPDVVPFDFSTASVDRMLARLDRFAGPLVRPTFDVSVVDVAEVTGVVVVRVPPNSVATGLQVGDVIVNAGGKPVTSAKDLRSQVAAATQAPTLPLDVRGLNGKIRSVGVPLVTRPDLLPLRGGSLVWNKTLLEMRDLVQTGATPEERAGARLNLAIVQMRLADWREARRELEQLTLPEGPGVSLGTVAYLTGLCEEKLGRVTEARAAFARAAASDGTLGVDGPPVRLLAQQELAPER